MARIAVVSAIDREIAPLYEQLESAYGWERKPGQIYSNNELGIELVAAVVGVGKVNSAAGIAEILTVFVPELVLNIGYAGGLAEGAGRGDIVVGNDYIQVDFASLSQPFSPGIIPGARPYVLPEGFIREVEQASAEREYRSLTGRIATGDFFLNDNARRAEIIRDFSPVAFDMESAAIAHVCAAKETAFAAVRTLSDLADEEAHLAAQAGLDELAVRPVEVILRALELYYGERKHGSEAL
ncbi:MULTISPECIES: 5'-methylthioadenosine/S-adenosylhomocysteine nucleosidase [unclassified Paenibacillus]|uniref:5'-methylthioadenosine/S-adenosylhomocysteine nucleosidase n=1 Tax=unclassified Paenibacillus TaxID=185978 RepID=UPI0024072AFE|nr:MULTISPECIES: 5'-methylthioadenosine/S-adenosylhomocysteine nucleosidase [unclassified Paenibacillus]MDF9844567.1 adenosylhomocysteine nucleosidase [Paenibacillus sp. PastF-2]MDF9851148.1 adenosylhomocysteine nucleosidase [Paenibacillus sp. PastM-2]MDF9856217.1 adenosylhomocysteine nucleosidase [Paenibacillus sp. PastF-1]MDH6481554.1 adenosylhomocysteine nucleosidase [Paenibacillus sp. PastH-2]MDH6510432.1 adenosylhomocysteine nucleosidase [Paenibacillus sp. PastM-3]